MRHPTKPNRGKGRRTRLNIRTLSPSRHSRYHIPTWSIYTTITLNASLTAGPHALHLIRTSSHELGRHRRSRPDSPGRIESNSICSFREPAVLAARPSKSKFRPKTGTRAWRNLDIRACSAITGSELACNLFKSEDCMGGPAASINPSGNVDFCAGSQVIIQSLDCSTAG